MENLKTDKRVTIVGVEITFYKGSTNKVVFNVEAKLIQAADEAGKEVLVNTVIPKVK